MIQIQIKEILKYWVNMNGLPKMNFFCVVRGIMVKWDYKNGEVRTIE